jgi:hypothetical protein
MIAIAIALLSLPAINKLRSLESSTRHQAQANLIYLEYDVAWSTFEQLTKLLKKTIIIDFSYYVIVNDRNV